jgi:hypothetical protein
VSRPGHCAFGANLLHPVTRLPKCDTKTPSLAHQPHPPIPCQVHMGKTAFYFSEKGHVTDLPRTAEIAIRRTAPAKSRPTAAVLAAASFVGQ